MAFDLTTGLLAAGALVLAGLGGQAWWAQRKGAIRRADAPPQPPADERIEPTLAGPAAAPGPGDDADPRIEPDGLRPPPMRRPARIDALIDAIVPMVVEAPVSGEAALAHLPASRRAGTKPLHIEGLNADSGDWEAPAAGQRYGEFQAAVQLANRHGALNEIEYSEFVQKVQAFAEAVGAMAEVPDMLDVVARARELDAFAQAHDATLVMRLRAQSVAWSVGYVQQCAARHGFVPGAVPGRLVTAADEPGAPPVLVLAFDAQAALADDPNQAALREVTLSLDVAQTPQRQEPFAAWQQAGRKLADDMDAVLVDEAGAPITLHAFSAIDEALAGLYRALEQRDLAAGSAAARRLFDG